MKKRLLALLMTLVMLLSLFPSVAIAQGEEGTIAPVAEEPEEGEDPSTRPEGLAQDDRGGGPEALPAADELQAVTASGSCGENLTWSLENGVLTISGTGAMTDWSNQSDSTAAPWYSYRESIRELVLPQGLTSIGNYALYECSSLASATIPDSVTSIGACAFFNCSSLANVTIPDSVTSIGNSAFGRCNSLTIVTIPGSVTSIGHSVFAGCSGLTEIRFAGSAPTFGSNVFSGVTGTAYYPENDETWTEEVRRNSGIQRWASYSTGPAVVASGTCGENLTWTLDENGILTISGTGAMTDWSNRSDSTKAPWYSYRTSIQEVVLPQGLTSIGNFALCECSSLASATIPDSVTSIGVGAFAGCSGLTNMTIPDSVTSIGASAFTGCRSMTSVTIPSGVMSIGDNAFDCCSSLASVTIPNSVTSIGAEAFWYCTGLTSVTIESGVTSIGSSAFYECSSLASVTIPDSVTSIGSSAFTYCRSLKEIYFAGSAPTFGADVFNSVTATAYYPENDETWTEEVRQSCGGSIIWVTYHPGTVIASGECGKNGSDLTWTLYEDGQLRIEGSGEMPDYPFDSSLNNGAPWASFSGSIKSIYVAAQVTQFGRYAFARLPEVETVVITEGNTAVGDWLFERDEKLRQVSLPEGLVSIGGHAFDCCYALSEINLPDGLTSIGQDAFYACRSLTHVTLPGSLVSIESGAFGSCTGIVEAVLLDGITEYTETGLFWNAKHIVLPASITKFDMNTFPYTKDASRRIDFAGTLEQWKTIPYSDVGSQYSSVYFADGEHDHRWWGELQNEVPAGCESEGTIAHFRCQACGALASDSGFAHPLSEEDCVIPALGHDWGEWVVTTPATVEQEGVETRSCTRCDATETRSYAAETVTIAFDAGGGSVDPTSTVIVKGESIGSLPTPVWTGHSFSGWFTAADGGTEVTADTPFSEDTTLYARWTLITYPITFDANGGEGAPEGQTKIHDTDLTLSTTEPTRADEAAGSCTVTLDPQGGSVNETSLAAERTEHFSFRIWNTAADGSGTSFAPGAAYTANEGVTLYAQWDSSTTTAAVTLPTPTRTGYRFLGWNTAADGTGTGFESGAGCTPSEDMTLYALWELEDDQPVFRVEEVRTMAGKEVEVSVKLENNPGIYALTVSFSYDNSALKLLAVTPNTQSFPGAWEAASLKGATWASNAGDITANDTILTLRFAVLEDAALGEHDVEVLLGEIINNHLDDIEFASIPGKVTVISHTPGDVNGDGTVGTRDFVILMKYLAQEDVFVVKEALDVNGDGTVGTKDFVTLMKYLAGEEIAIY